MIPSRAQNRRDQKRPNSLLLPVFHPPRQFDVNIQCRVYSSSTLPWCYSSSTLPGATSAAPSPGATPAAPSPGATSTVTSPGSTPAAPSPGSTPAAPSPGSTPAAPSPDATLAVPTAVAAPSTAVNPALLSPQIAEPDIAAAVELRRRGMLSDKQKMRFIQSTLKVPREYPFPYSVGYKGVKNFVSHKHVSGERYGNYYFSPALKGLFCLPCVLFAPLRVGRGNNQPTGRLVTDALCVFHKLTGKSSHLDTHLERSYHEEALIAMKSMKQSLATGSVSALLQTHHSQQIARNREILRAVLHEIETCARLNLALRGHRDHGPLQIAANPESIDYGQGNLRAFLQKAALKDQTLADHLRHGSRNASYISPETQNHLISAMGTVMLSAVSDPIRKVKLFALQADETSDLSRTEQLTVTIRYIDENNEICESFIGFTSMESTTGRALTEALMSQVAALGLQPENMVAQAYDGASNMSGAFNGVQALIRERCQHAVSIHCFWHALNLVLSRASTIPEIRSAITGIQDAYNFFKNSSLRTEQFKNAIEKICPKSNHSRLKQHCASRWVERHDSIFIFLELYKLLLSLLNTNQERSLANIITEPSFLVSVHVLQEVLGLTKNLSTTLQSKKMNFISAVPEIDEVIDTLQSWRQDDCDSTFDAAFSAADKLYSEIESDDDAHITIPRLAGRQRNRANVPADTPRQYYKCCIWYPYVDSVLTELRERFNKHSKTAFSLALILPANCIDN